MYDEYKTYQSTSTDFLPMYSSFSKDNQLHIPELPGKKMQVENDKETTEEPDTRRSQMFDTLHKKQENMFKRVSPERSLLRVSKSAFELPKDKSKKQKQSDPFTESKTTSLLKKCALQGIRAGSFKKI